MSERKSKVKKKIKGKDEVSAAAADNKTSAVEYKVAKYLKAKLPPKKTKFLNHQVNYFNGNKAIDLLLDSQWATGDDPLFSDRQSVVDFGNKMLQHRFFHRAKKIAVTDKDLTNKELKKKKEKEKEKISGKKVEAEEKEGKKEDSENGEEKNDKEKDKSLKKKKTKIKLDMHLEQVFVDSSDAFVWMYDPIPFWYYIAGALLLCAAVGICLFPLWPPSVRQGVYYLSMAAASFLGLIFGLAIVRFIVFSFIWILSLGRHHFWILPNLTEDVSFLASFWPLYHYEYSGVAYDKKNKSKSKRKKDDKSEQEGTNKERSDIEGEHLDSVSAGETDKPETDAERASEAHSVHTDNTDSEHSNSQTFEMVSKEDVAGHEDTSEDDD